MLERASDRWVAIALSVLLHGSLVAAVAYGFWTYHQSRPPAPTLAIEATVVDARAVNGAALKTPPQPQPPAPAPTPAPSPEAEPVEPTGPPEPTPEELAQREHAQQEQAVKEQEAKEQAERDAAEQQRKLEEQKQQQDAERQAEEKRQQLQVQKQREAEKAEADRKAAEAKARAEAAQREADAKVRAERESDLRNSLAAEEHANAVRASGALASWESQITARIQRAWLRPPSARSGIECVLHVTQAPGGVVSKVSLGECNGDQAVRESIEAAAYRASPLPPPPDPSLFESDLEITFKPD